MQTALLLLHLGMSGRITAGSAGAAGRTARPCRADARRRHRHPLQRRRAASACSTTSSAARRQQHPLLAGLGPEPLEAGFDGAYLAAALAGKLTPIKSALLDQRIVAGLGNIYVCEALFRAGRLAAPARRHRSAGARAERLVSGDPRRC